MDVHGTKLARTLFTIATGMERGAVKGTLLAKGDFDADSVPS